MPLIRTDAQVALSDLLASCQRSVVHYRDSAAYLRSSSVSSVLQDLAKQRESVCHQLEAEIRRHGDLPSVPDEDRETVDSLYHRVHASLAADDQRDVLEQHLSAEQGFSEQLSAHIASGQFADESELLHELQKQARASAARLREILSQQSIK